METKKGLGLLRKIAIILLIVGLILTWPVSIWFWKIWYKTPKRELIPGN